MKIINLYKYQNGDGSTTITPNKKSETDVPYNYRLIAGEGMALTDGITNYYCVDTDDVSKYQEIIDPEINMDIVQKAEAFDYLTGRSDGDE